VELTQLVKLQREFDRKHGWAPDVEDPTAITNFLVRDLVGLFGEMGEFANCVKKIQLAHPSGLPEAFAEQVPLLKEELVDFMIYVLRFAAYLELDLEKEYIAKVSVNESRFQRFLVDGSTEAEPHHE